MAMEALPPLGQDHHLVEEETMSDPRWDTYHALEGALAGIEAAEVAIEDDTTSARKALDRAWEEVSDAWFMERQALRGRDDD